MINDSLLDQLRVSTGAIDAEYRGTQFVRLHYDRPSKRNSAQFALQQNGWAAYPVASKGWTLEIYYTDSPNPELITDMLPKRPTAIGDTLIKHIKTETPVLKTIAEYGFYEIIKDRRGRWVIIMVGGVLGSQRLQLGFDADELKFEIERIRDYDYLNIMGTWTEKWTMYDGSKSERFLGDLVTFKLRDGKRHDEEFQVDTVEYFAVCEQLKDQNYRRAIRPKKNEGEQDLETWLASDKMNIVR